VNAEISAEIPATIMRRHADATLYCDPDSGAELL
jgi:6-phosphogluconolactonase/glucosamine-6-phosphate isomerase/deaminase